MFCILTGFNVRICTFGRFCHWSRNGLIGYRNKWSQSICWGQLRVDTNTSQSFVLWWLVVLVVLGTWIMLILKGKKDNHHQVFAVFHFICNSLHLFCVSVDLKDLYTHLNTIMFRLFSFCRLFSIFKNFQLNYAFLLFPFFFLSSLVCNYIVPFVLATQNIDKITMILISRQTKIQKRYHFSKILHMSRSNSHVSSVVVDRFSFVISNFDFESHPRFSLKKKKSTWFQHVCLS